MVLVYIIFGVIIGVLMFAAFLLLPINGVYMFLFEREEWRYWMKFSRNVKKFEYVGLHAGDGTSYEFIWDNYKAIVWSGHYGFDGYASVHSKDGEEVLATMFWRSKSKKFTDKLMCKLPTELK
jgi:hypothetical protein